MNIEYRKTNQNDNLEKLAELIYIVDPYIYPYWFSNLQNCKNELSKLILEEGFIFNINTTYIAVNKDNNEIIGIAQIVSYKTNLDYDYSELIMKDPNYKYTIENYIIPMINEIKEKKIMTVTNFSVDGSYRNNGIGTNLLDYALREETNNYKELFHIKFEVIAENYGALKVYNKLGFKQKGFMEEGFNGEGLPKPFVVFVEKETSSGIRNVYLIEKDLVSFRRAGFRDNFTEIAQLLYQTDPYIYPYWFEEEQKCIDFLKEEGVWVFGADMDGEDYASVDFDLPCALVIGNEGKGIGTLTAKKCDRIVSLPMCGKINSLNASVAAGVLMYEALRKRRKK